MLTTADSFDEVRLVRRAIVPPLEFFDLISAVSLWDLDVFLVHGGRHAKTSCGEFETARALAAAH